MTDRALLPTGLEDVLPIDAQYEASVADHLMSTFASLGYDRVKPPMIEFEDNLLQGSGEAISAQTFRVMDPASQRMLGIRPDMTVQVERIACTRLVNAPRPLRLSYTGQVLRVKGSQLRPERQFGQAGVELIGSDAHSSDCEVILLAVEALTNAGAKNLSVDLGLPSLVPAICESLDIDDETKSQLRTALDRKDAASVKALGGKAADLFSILLDSAGPAKQAIETLKSLKLDGKAQSLCQSLISVYELAISQSPELNITIDAVENRGYEYHTGVTYTFYAKGARGELGRGGRYVAGSGEAAVGFTLFIDSLMRALPKAQAPEKLFVPFGTDAQESAKLRQQGNITVNGLQDESDVSAEAKRLGCSHIFLNGKIEPLVG
ncbi:ATP phosphoribosyltransferase regulatory subunit [Candidatus Terasakiella magnetica]|uniref:ATP phosphoribosyltransferase regulatory subunit n=1 Tax=Candidatus Terasakiella magnetica TaxID=1867952 RepID=A0A1C3RL65_9PROT|nr:ATP phosphoribosyltransferase regulatory subunit [Candidatus Terasakiella magnetica]SCA58026.1 ATP phosphoribosyltransferase regulatory subunit [Candidatus Terasakiella magnetica]